MHYYGRTLEVAKQNAPHPAKGAAFYKVPNQQAYYVIDEDGNIFDFGAAAPGGGTELLSFQLTIPSAQILTLFDTPVEIIAAPGVGKQVQVISANIATTGGTPYDTSTALFFKYVNADEVSGFNFNALLSSNPITQLFSLNAGASANQSQLVENEAVTVLAQSNNPQNGDFDIVISGTYTIQDV